ncbi:MAG TPA: 50S ribosomal protein L25 [Acidimicrobiales bacterium]
MAQNLLVADTGRSTGSRSSNRLRGEGKVPAVVYGHGMTPVSITIDRRELRHVLTGAAGFNTVVDLKVGDTTHHTVVKEMQRHPIKRIVTHVDFVVVRMDEAITVDVAIELVGEPKAVLNDGGVIDQMMHSLEVDTTPANMPGAIVVDISDMQPGDVITIGDLPLPDGCSTSMDPDAPVAVAASTAAAEAAVTEGEGEGETEAAEPGLVGDDE